MTITRATPSEPASPETPDSIGPRTSAEAPSFPEVLGALSCKWSRTSSVPTTALPSTKADEAVGGRAWDVVDEWGLGSFPASDPPSNW